MWPFEFTLAQDKFPFSHTRLHVASGQHNGQCRSNPFYIMAESLGSLVEDIIMVNLFFINQYMFLKPIYFGHQSLANQSAFFVSYMYHWDQPVSGQVLQ